LKLTNLNVQFITVIMLLVEYHNTTFVSRYKSFGNSHYTLYQAVIQHRSHVRLPYSFVFIKTKKHRTSGVFRFGGSEGSRSRLRARSGRESDSPPGCHSTPLPCSTPHFLLFFQTKNTAQAVFFVLVEARGVALACGLGPVADLTAHRAVIQHRSHVRLPYSFVFIKTKKHRTSGVFRFGGSEGSRTPVRKPIHGTFYECMLPIQIPRRAPDNRGASLGSFFMRDCFKSKQAVHVHH